MSIRTFVKRNFRRIGAAALAGAVLATSIHFDHFGLFKEAKVDSYAFHRAYGVCTDNHSVSGSGANCMLDQYAPITEDTSGLAHGSAEWQEAIDRNVKVLREAFGNDEMIARVFWGGIVCTVTDGGAAAVDQSALEGANYWFNYAQDAIRDAQNPLNQYADTTIQPTFTPMSESQYGTVRHVGRDSAVFTSNPLFAYLSNPETCFPTGGSWNEIKQNLYINRGKGYGIVRLSKAWKATYAETGMGTGGIAEWPVRAAENYITLPFGATPDHDTVVSSALDIAGDASYYYGGIGIEGKGSSGGDGSAGATNELNEYWIDCTEAFFSNVGSFKFWDTAAGTWIDIPALSFTNPDAGQTGPVYQINGWEVAPYVQNVNGKMHWFYKLTWKGAKGAEGELLCYADIPEGSFVADGGVSYNNIAELAADFMTVNRIVPGTCPRGKDAHLHQTFVQFRPNPAQRNLPAFKFNAKADPIPGQYDAKVHFCIFRHTEDWQSDYNVQLYKYDYETGEPLDGAVFELYEKFDDQDQINRTNDGAAELYEGKQAGAWADGKTWQSTYTSSPVVWDNFRLVGSHVTDANGHIGVDVPKNYHYEKTYCDGHPAPVFETVPEEELDPETGEVVNQPEIDKAQQENMDAAEKWSKYVEACEKRAADKPGVHFHWVSDSVDPGAIADAEASGGEPGSTPDGGPSDCFDFTEAYEKSGCKADTEATYDKFINLRYSYTWKEYKAREGYMRHDVHTDDVPIEVITTNSSQAGAVSSFAIGDEYYDTEMTINLNAGSATPSGDDGDDEGDDGDDETGGPMGIGRRTLSVSHMGAGSASRSNISDDPYTVPDIDYGKNVSIFDQTVIAFTNFVSDAIDDIRELAATPSNAVIDKEDSEEVADDEIIEDIDLFADDAETEEEIPTATPSNAPSVMKKSVQNTGNPITNLFTALLSPLGAPGDDDDDEGESGGSSGGGSSDFEVIYTGAFDDGGPQWRSTGAHPCSVGSVTHSSHTDSFKVELGPDDLWSHCNDEDGEGNAWRIYDHRTPGEIHFNKRDFDLGDNVSDKFDDYAEENGDGKLEGAVYGLFASKNIEHPDGYTGTVYQKDDLVAVATTDRNGDGSFLVYTEAPGTVWDYSLGYKKTTAWNASAPKNLYRLGAKTEDKQPNVVFTDCHETGWTADDYTADKGHDYSGTRNERLYDNNEDNNGNCWIGQPLILGEYYIKELARSEGYELSISGALNAHSNFDPENPQAAFEMVKTDGQGTVKVSRNLYIHGQESVAENNEPLFEVSSLETAQGGGYDIVVSKLPEGTKFYRQDISNDPADVQVITGYQMVDKLDEFGNPVYKVAATDRSDPKYVGDGTDTIQTQSSPASYTAGAVPVVTLKTFDDTAIQSAINATADDSAKLIEPYTGTGDQYRYAKIKLEQALRTAGLTTPYTTDSGYRRFSTDAAVVYSRGIREGEVDIWGVSGVPMGEIANKTVYGPQIISVQVPKENGGAVITTGDFIMNLVQYYVEHPYWTFGGIDNVYDDGTEWNVRLYAYNHLQSAAFAVVDGDDKTAFIRKEFDPDDLDQKPYYVYAKYTETGAEDDAAGTYTRFEVRDTGTRKTASVVLYPDVTIGGDGSVNPVMITSPVYHSQGEVVLDKHGNPVVEQVAKPVYGTVTIEQQNAQYTELQARYENGKHIIHIDMPYTTAFGKTITDMDGITTLYFKAVVPEASHVLTEEEAEKCGGDYSYLKAGDTVSGGLYEVAVLKARADVYTDYDSHSSSTSGTFVKSQSLVYPNQESFFQDGDGNPGEGTIASQVKVQERPIRQKIRVNKDIQTLTETKDVWYCSNCGFEMADGVTVCTHCGDTRTNEETKRITYRADTYSSAHKDNKEASGGTGTITDWLRRLITGEEQLDSAKDIPNFRFKAYLRSNLERLYRDNDGNVTWVDRNGNVLTPVYYDKNHDGNYDTAAWKYESAYGGKEVDWPEKDKMTDTALDSSNVQKIYTKVLHELDSITTSGRANNVWANYGTPQGGDISQIGELKAYETTERPQNELGSRYSVDTNASLFSFNGKNDDVAESDKINSLVNKNTGFTRILETTPVYMEDGASGGRFVETYNYEKFFDAIAAANADIWDNDMYSSYSYNGYSAYGLTESMANYPGQRWFDTFYEKYQKDDTDDDHVVEAGASGNGKDTAATNNADADNTAGGDKNTSFKPFRWIREHVFGTIGTNEDRPDYRNYPALNGGQNTEVITSTSHFARANAEASDAVRQFAVKWYLEQEAAKLITNNGNDENVARTDGNVTGYDEAAYDQALFEAIAKAYEYLKPFYENDLDTIYAVEWDSEASGGEDLDYTTLSADMDNGESYVGISSYLPYGTYVIVEQQPERSDSLIEDFENRHYTIERPKEVMVPSVYQGQPNNTTDNYDTHYFFDNDMSLTDQSKASNYLIRFGEEWSKNNTQDMREYVIRAHNWYGDFEVYPYGMDTDKVNKNKANRTITYPGGSYDYFGWNYTQDATEPLKDYYDTEHNIWDKNEIYAADGS